MDPIFFIFIRDYIFLLEIIYSYYIINIRGGSIRWKKKDMEQ